MADGNSVRGRLRTDGGIADTLHGALREWDYRNVESQFNVTTSVSIPCQLRFTGPTDQDTDRFHDALKERGLPPIDTEPDRRRTDQRPHYDGEVMIRDKYHRIRVLVYRGGVVRIYPHDEYVPRRRELAALLEALKAGFGAPLEHDPIEQEGSA